MNRRRVNKRIRVDDRFDETEPMAGAIRSLLPGDVKVDPAARERITDRALAVQRDMNRRRAGRRVFRSRRALVPATAFVLAAAVLAAVLIPVLSRGPSKRMVEFASPARFLNLVGSVEVRPPRGRWRQALPDDMLGRGWSVRTGDGALASVHFPDGSITRVTDGSEARIARVAADEVSIQHISGGTYHRVQKGTSYTVVNSDVSSRALGTAFNVENRVPEYLEILTVESAIDVSIGSHEPIRVSQGEVITVSMSQDKKADKQPVSRERLQDSRLVASVQQDAEAGYSTGVYEKVDVPVNEPQQPAQSVPSQAPSIQMAGNMADLVATLSWTMTGVSDYGSLVLLRSEGSEPIYPDNEIARYSDTSISSATDDTIQKGHTYQYRVAGIPSRSGEVVYSNTVVLEVPAPQPQPGAVSISLETLSSSEGVTVEWGVSGTTGHSGFVLERVVEKAPRGSATPAGSTWSTRIQSSDVFYSYVDATVAPEHTYSYRVGLVVGGAVMAYSEWRTVEVARR